VGDCGVIDSTKRDGGKHEGRHRWGPGALPGVAVRTGSRSSAFSTRPDPLGRGRSTRPRGDKTGMGSGHACERPIRPARQGFDLLQQRGCLAHVRPRNHPVSWLTLAHNGRIGPGAHPDRDARPGRSRDGRSERELPEGRKQAKAQAKRDEISENQRPRVDVEVEAYGGVRTDDPATAPGEETGSSSSNDTAENSLWRISTRWDDLS